MRPLIISTFRTSPLRGARVTCAIGCISLTGECTLCPRGRVVLLAGGRAQWRRVLPLLRQYERLRHWCTPALRRVPGTDAVLLAELARLGATLEALVATPPPKALPYGDNARLG